MVDKEWRQAYYKKNKVQMLARMKEYRALNPEKARENFRSYIRDHEGHTYLDKSGYTTYVGFKHPATNACGITREHRIILWDKLKGKGAMCYWGCGKWVSWDRTYPYHKDALVADHLNLDKADNDPDNLVPSCQHCNSSRAGGRLKANVRQGEDSLLAKIRNEDVIAIKERLLKGEDSKVIALDYPVVEWCAIHAIHRDKTWKDIGPSMAGVYEPDFKHTTALQKIEMVARIKAGQTLLYIAEEMGYGASAIARLFKRETGMSVMEYKRAFRAGTVQ